MRVELLYSDTDPNYMTARQRLVEVLGAALADRELPW